MLWKELNQGSLKYFICNSILFRKSDEMRDLKTLIVDALKSGVRFQKCVAEAWLKVNLVISSSFISCFFHTINIHKMIVKIN